jgi:RimJ/RimL family protein N-acetyltransferase
LSGEPGAPSPEQEAPIAGSGTRSFELGAPSPEQGAPIAGSGTRSSQPATLHARGDRVWVAPVHTRDISPYRRAVEQSRTRLGVWNPVDPDDLVRALSLQSPNRRTFLVHALTPEGDHDIVGKINVVDAVRGRFESASMGYDAYDPYVGRGLFAEGLRLVLDLAFRPESAGGMGLHRVQATVQPGNVRSAGLLRSLGFQREGFSPRMLWLPGVEDTNAWRDHVSYVMLRDEWPAQPYVTAHRRKVVALVNGGSGSGVVSGASRSGPTVLARQLAQELRIPLFAEDVAGTGDRLWALLADSPGGGVVQGCFRPEDEQSVVQGLRRCGLDPAAVPEVWCLSALVKTSERPLGVGPTVPIDTSRGVERADVVRIALRVASEVAPPFET